jgi:LL-diaminopimelate aminotransferase
LIFCHRSDFEYGKGIQRVNKLPAPAARLNRFAPNPFATLAPRIAKMNAAGRDVIRLDMGSPDLPPPPSVVEALARSASDATHHGYSTYRGDPAFRRAVAGYYLRRFGVELDPNTEVLPLIGSKEGLANLSVAYLDRGDAALVPSLAYPTYAAGALLAGGDPITIPLREEDGYLPDFDAPIPGIERAKLLWVNYPNNPTGATANLDFYDRAVEFCRKHGLLLCSDNPYCDVTFDGYRAPSALQVDGAKDCTVEFMSLSKTFNMAGWRLGAAVGNKTALDNLLHIKSTIDTAGFKAIYDAGIDALENTPQSWLDARNERYCTRRDQIIAALSEIGLESVKPPRASLYIWAKIAHGGVDTDWCNSALEEAAVSVTPGSTYGDEGRHYVRFSLGVSEERLEIALNRLREWYKVHA